MSNVVGVKMKKRILDRMATNKFLIKRTIITKIICDAL